MAGNSPITLVGQDEWRSLDSAPRDGTYILLAAAGEWVSEGRFCEDEGLWYELNNHPTDSWGWPLSPTHWRPKPAPPEKQ